MEQRVSLITLGVADLGRSRSFYSALGWLEWDKDCPDIAFFQLHGQALALYPMRELLSDQGQADPRPGGITLSINLGSREEAAAAHRAFIAAGGKNIKTPEDTPWGGFSGYASDPDGHPWEFAFVPMFPLGPDGALRLPGRS